MKTPTTNGNKRDYDTRYREMKPVHDLWRQVTVHCILVDLKKHRAVNPELAAWAKAQKEAAP